jgi:hypothetical protein
MGLSSRKRTNRRFNGTKMVVNNTGTASTIVPKNDFSQTNQYNQIAPDENNFVPCTTGQGLYNSEFSFNGSTFIYSVCDINNFYEKNKLLVSFGNSSQRLLNVVNSQTGELINSREFDGFITNISKIGLNRHLISGNFSGFAKIINSDLTNDNSFISPFNIVSNSNSVFSAPTIDGKFIIAGTASNSPYKISASNRPTYYQQIYRLNSNGTVDTTYYTNTTFGLDSSTQLFPYSSTLRGILPLNDGSVILWGNKIQSYRNVVRPGIFKLNNVGNVDETFDCELDYFDGNNVTSVIRKSNGNIVFCGNFRHSTSSNSNLLEVDSSGNTINDLTIPDNLNAQFLVLDVDDKVIVVSSNFNSPYVRYNNDWTIDTTFNTETIKNGSFVSGMYKSSNGGYFLYGIIQSINNNPINNLAKLKGC